MIVGLVITLVVLYAGCVAGTAYAIVRLNTQRHSMSVLHTQLQDAATGLAEMAAQVEQMRKAKANQLQYNGRTLEPFE